MMQPRTNTPSRDEIADLTNKVRRAGYAVTSEWHPNRDTLELAELIGSVIRLGATWPSRDIPTVQTLRPLRTDESTGNRYSGNYGLGAFPLHTDMAHWYIPPRFLLLRCEKGSRDVTTVLVPAPCLRAITERSFFVRALLQPRRPRAGEPLCLLPLRFSRDDTEGLRWDSLFVRPANEPARRFAEAVNEPAWIAAHAKKVALASPGDTLVLDNWRCLHGRSRVAAADTDRIIQRVYLSSLHR